MVLPYWLSFGGGPPIRNLPTSAPSVYGHLARAEGSWYHLRPMWQWIKGHPWEAGVIAAVVVATVLAWVRLTYTVP